MNEPVFLDAAAAVSRFIKDGMTVANISMTLLGASCEVYKAIEKSYLELGHPRDLTLLHTGGFSDKVSGMEHFAHPGLLRRIVGSHWGLAPKLMSMIDKNEVEAYNMPLGVLSNMFHNMCAKLPGTLSREGLGTYLDPREQGGRMNEVSRDTYVKLMEMDGQEFLMYRHVPMDVLMIRGTYADEDGNITAKDEAIKLENLSATLACKRYGGRVIVQVKGVLRKGTIPAKEVDVPGCLVDCVVVSREPEVNHRQTSSWYMDTDCTGGIYTAASQIMPIPLNERKVIVRRAMRELFPNCIVNVGTGIPNDCVGAISAEENVDDMTMVTVESGIYGGVQSGGPDFGIARNPVALVPENLQFDLYNGRGVDFTFMGAGEMDRLGNINVTKMGGIVPGCGGFVDITGTAKCVLFCSTFTSRGLKVSFDPVTGVTIEREGEIRKLVYDVKQKSYNARRNIQNGQRAFYVTERCVFRIDADGPVLIEIAKGVDLKRDILAQMDFVPAIDPNLREIPTDIYNSGMCGLRDVIIRNA